MLEPLITAALAVLAQTPPPPIGGEFEALPAPPQGGAPQVRFSFGGGYEMGFDSDLDRGGEVGIDRFTFNVAAQTDLSETLELALRFGLGLDSYDFSDDNVAFAAFGGEPWDDILTVGAGAIFTLQATNDWSIFAGPVVQSSRQSGADWGDSIIGGGVIGASWRVASDLTLGGGVGVVTQIEDDVRVFPIIIAEWQINDEFRLSSQAASNASGRSGLELIYRPGGERHPWEFALGGASQFSRFRLEEDGPVPEGIGEDKSTAFWLRASWEINPNATVSGLFGLTMDGELELENRDADRLRREDYDGAPFLGFVVNFQF